MKTVTGTVHIGSETKGCGSQNGRGEFESLEEFLSELRSIGDEYDVLVQAFDARYIAGQEHLEAAHEHATRSMERAENVADDFAVEVLLYAAGRRQIDRAMTLGLGTGERSVIVLLDGERVGNASGAVRDQLVPGPVEPDERAIMEFFDITPAERRVTSGELLDLVLERVALLDVEK